MRIALATAGHYPALADDDRVLHEEMIARGISATPVVWDSDADWSAYDTVVVRSIWDYHLKYDRFLEWLSALEASGKRVHNSVNVLRWNADKHYMRDLEERGVRITPTRVVERGSNTSLSELLKETGWRNYVVKPTVSSTGYETWFSSTPVSADDQQRFALQSAQMDLLVQEFASGVHSGERSFVFIDGEFMHCILKRAAAHEFRVQIEHGGTVERVEANEYEIAWAQGVIDAWGVKDWTYARVDAVAGDQGLMLMELELLDPELFFSYNRAAIQRFIARITR